MACPFSASHQRPNAPKPPPPPVHPHPHLPRTHLLSSPLRRLSRARNGHAVSTATASPTRFFVSCSRLPVSGVSSPPCPHSSTPSNLTLALLRSGIHFVIITGNPGIVNYYETFAAACSTCTYARFSFLHGKNVTSCACTAGSLHCVTVIGHLGHTTRAITDCHTFSLAQQRSHKAEALRTLHLKVDFAMSPPRITSSSSSTTPPPPLPPPPAPQSHLRRHRTLHRRLPRRARSG
jgi:hypothetical protein